MPSQGEMRTCTDSAYEMNVFSLRLLRTLRLDNNRISALPAEVFQGLSQLEALHLGYNELSELPSGVFDSLTSLRDLRIYGNRFSTLHVHTFDSLQLQVLDISGNPSLACIPMAAETFGALSYYRGPAQRCQECAPQNNTPGCKCPAGYTGPDGGPCLIPCAPGSYKSLTGSSACVSCPLSTTSPPASSSSEDCRPPATTPAPTGYRVRLVFSLPMSIIEFTTPDTQQKFIAALAATVGVPAAAVQVERVEVVGGRRRILAEAILVHTSVTVADASTAEQLKTNRDNPLRDFNRRLAELGLPAAQLVAAGSSGANAAVPLPPPPPSGRVEGMVVGITVTAGLVVIVCLVAGFLVYVRRQQASLSLPFSSRVPRGGAVVVPSRGKHDRASPAGEAPDVQRLCFHLFEFNLFEVARASIWCGCTRGSSNPHPQQIPSTPTPTPQVP